MSTYTQIYYHIVFSTKNRVPVLHADRREELLRYLWGVLNKNDCHLYRINAVEDHVHIFTSLHQTVALARLVKDLKVASSSWIKDERIFPKFDHWQDGYGAFTHSHAEKERLIAYVMGQQQHHKKVDYREELIALLEEAGVEFDEKYLL